MSKLDCPYCCSYEVDRMLLGSAGLDSCRCRACGAIWDEELETGEFRGRGSRTSTVLPRESGGIGF